MIAEPPELPVVQTTDEPVVDDNVPGVTPEIAQLKVWFCAEPGTIAVKALKVMAVPGNTLLPQTLGVDWTGGAGSAVPKPAGKPTVKPLEVPPKGV